MTPRQVWFVGILSGLAVILLTSVYLNQQGLYYDEAHQAPASFRYVGGHPPMFLLEFNDIPILNLPYSGAIKSMVYGLYLLCTKAHFSVFSWRLLGILFVAIGLFCFYLVAGRFLSWGAAALFTMLLITDVNVLVTTRFDWGPTALALGLRLLFVGVWLSMALGVPTDRKRFVAGLIVGIAIFEKLAAIALVGPLLLALFAGRRFSARGSLKAVAGVLIGTLPLVYANYSSLRHGGGFVSLAAVTRNNDFSLHGAKELLYQYFALGHGEKASSYVFGNQMRFFWLWAEVGLMIFLVGFVLIMALRSRKPVLSLAGQMAIAYMAVVTTLFLIPQATSAHHWIQGTPFQYLAMALTFQALRVQPWTRGVFVIAVGVLLLARIPNVVYAERGMIEGWSTPQYDRRFTRLGEFAAANKMNAVFIAADWGTGAQIYCLGNGEDRLVYEPFGSANPVESTKFILSQADKRTAYVVISGLSPDFGPVASSIMQVAENSPGWKEEPIERELRDLSPMRVRKFVRR